MQTHALAALFHGPGEPLELRRLALPTLGRGEVLVRVHCCTLCGSDLHTWRGSRPTPTPTILGHEILGEVAALGPGEPATDLAGRPLRPGTRITWSVAVSCGECFFCARDLPQKCSQLFKFGHEALGTEPSLSGGLAEYCHLPAGTACVRVPAELPDRVATPASCATATVAAAMRRAGGCEDEVVLIFGAGVLGLTACAMAAQRGARAVIVCDPVEERRARAELFGATHAIPFEMSSKTPCEIVGELSEGRGADLAFEMSGASAAVAAAIDALRVGGRAVFAGSVLPTPAADLDPELLVRGMLSLHGVHNYAPVDLGTAMDFLAASWTRYPFEALVGPGHPLDEVPMAFERAAGGAELRVAVCP